MTLVKGMQRYSRSNLEVEKLFANSPTKEYKYVPSHDIHDRLTNFILRNKNLTLAGIGSKIKKILTPFRSLRTILILTFKIFLGPFPSELCAQMRVIFLILFRREKSKIDAKKVIYASISPQIKQQ